MAWNEEFQETYRVSRYVTNLVEAGLIEDMSWRNDPSPSFGAKLKDKNWVRLWVEHPDPELRQGWPKRYTIVIQPEPDVLFGWKMMATDDLNEALAWLTHILLMKGPRWRFDVQDAV